MLQTGKAQFSIKDDKGYIFHLLDVADEPSWFDVKTVEEHRAPCGTLLSVVNHREKTFSERKDELRKQIGNDGVDVTSFGGTYLPKALR